MMRDYELCLERAITNIQYHHTYSQTVQYYPAECQVLNFGFIYAKLCYCHLSAIVKLLCNLIELSNK